MGGRPLCVCGPLTHTSPPSPNPPTHTDTHTPPQFTGIYTNFVGKHAYLSYAVQHPAAAIDGVPVPPATMLSWPAPGFVGYIGPLDAGEVTGVPGPALQAAAFEKVTGKHVSAEHIVWTEAKGLVVLTFEPVPYTNPRDVEFNAIPLQTTARVCAGPQ